MPDLYVVDVEPKSFTNDPEGLAAKTSSQNSQAALYAKIFERRVFLSPK